MTSRIYNAQAKEYKQKLNDFFSVYFDAKVAKQIDNHPDMAIPTIREAIKDGIPSKERLSIYAGALKAAIEYTELRESKSDF